MINLLRIFKYLKPYKSKLFIAFVLLISGTSMNIVQPRLSQYAIDNGIALSDVSVVIWCALGLLLIGLSASSFNYSSGYILIKSSQRMCYDLRNSLFKKVTQFSFYDFDKWRTGELIVRLNSDVNTIQRFIRMGLFIMVLSVIMLIGAIAGMFLIDSYLASVITFILVSILILFYLIAKFVRPLFRKSREFLDKLNNVIQENLAGAGLVRAFARQKEEQKKFNKRNKDYYYIGIKIGIVMSIIMPLLMTIANLTGLTAIWIGGFGVGNNNLTLGELIAFQNYSTMAIFPIIMLAMVLNFISMAIASADRIYELHEVKPKIVEPKNPVKKNKLLGKIEFRNVSFHFGNGLNVLNNINFTINQGEKIGIIGTTGAGKSTITHLITRFYDVNEGEILIDGINIKKLSLETIRSRINIALQETLLFQGQ